MSIVYILIFPGFLFLFAYSLFLEFIDRKAYARLQNRVGPPIFQPWADFFKLLSKEELVPERADRRMFTALPIIGIAAVLTAFVYIPVWGPSSPFPFIGDIIVVIYLLSLPTLILFLAGWHSTNLFSTVGAVRALTQLFGYEVPFLLALLSPALITGIWKISDIVNYQVNHIWFIAYLPLALIVAVISLVGKLERIPFDIPEAETEIVGGPLTEYSGKRLALFRLMINIEMVAGSALIAVLFLGGYSMPGIALTGIPAAVAGFFAFVAKTVVIVFVLSCIKALFARLRIEQMVTVCLKWLAPMLIIQLLVVVGLKYAGIL
ncbi:NADH-quinone oxidoreductase subunit H [Chloroflexota bacterium]